MKIAISERLVKVAFLLALNMLLFTISAGAALRAPAATPNSVTLAWTAPGDDGDVGTAGQYDIRYSTSNITVSNWASATQVTGEPSPQIAGSAEELDITGLTPSTIYYFAIMTADEVPNWSGLSNIVSKSTSAEETPPGAVADLSTGSATANSLTLSWTAPGDDSTSGMASQYDIRYSTSLITSANWNGATQVSGETAPQTAGASESFVVSGLAPNTIYYFAIMTADEVPNWSSLSNVPNGATSTETTPPAVIANLGVSSTTEHTATLSWTAPGDDGNTGTATQYDIRFHTVAINAGNWDAAPQATGEPSPQLGGSLESFTVSGLNSTTTYYFAIRTADEIPNWSGVSNSPEGTTSADATSPLVVANLNVGMPTPTSLMIVWTAPGDDGSDGTAAQYDIRYALSSITEANWSAATQISGEPSPHIAGTPESLTVTGLVEGQMYYFALKTADEAPNWSGLSNVAGGSTETDTTPPSTINDLSASAGQNDGDLELTWTSPGDDGSVGTAWVYFIRYSPEPIDEANWESAAVLISPPSPLPAGTSQEATISSLVPGATYYVAARAYDDASNESELSNVATGEAKWSFPLANEDIAQPCSPACNAVVPTTQPLLTVENANSATDNMYCFEVATDSNFFGLVASEVVSQEMGGTTSWKISARLQSNQEYFWRVGTNLDGYSQTSNFRVESFTHAYPNPVRPSLGQQATFTDLPEGGDLVVMSLSGNVIRSWDNLSGNDIVWNITNETGSQVATGTYLWYVPDTATKGKLVVVR
ncbi:MAG: hypothetical protein DRP45_05915 [Candidatus Zixiibacteriota bacterium]|nr:MAG: hypothetical protein DRP45_05915 [candidate division Zixibacteria bacterium]